MDNPFMTPSNYFTKDLSEQYTNNNYNDQSSSVDSNKYCYYDNNTNDNRDNNYNRNDDNKSNDYRDDNYNINDNITNDNNYKRNDDNKSNDYRDDNYNINDDNMIYDTHLYNCGKTTAEALKDNKGVIEGSKCIYIEYDNEILDSFEKGWNDEIGDEKVNGRSVGHYMVNFSNNLALGLTKECKEREVEIARNSFIKGLLYALVFMIILFVIFYLVGDGLDYGFMYIYTICFLAVVIAILVFVYSFTDMGKPNIKCKLTAKSK